MNIFKFINISLLLFLLFFLFASAKVPLAYAADNSFVTVVNPVRGQDFWDLKDQLPSTAVSGQIKISREFNIPMTWLVRFDVLSNTEIINLLKSSPNEEIGLFLEVTPSWTQQANVLYQRSPSWHFALSALLTGYSTTDREKLIDSAFDNFRKTFGYYPKSVGAWYVDSYSLSYMQKKYHIISSLIVADQYTTDNYQIWGQYWSTPYYPSKTHTLIPAHSPSDKLPVVITQWAARDPINGYGRGVEESTFSVQANDYIDYHKLTADYFAKLVDIYTTQKFNQFGQVTVGLENSYSWSKYQDEYKNQIKVLDEKRKIGQFAIVTMADFADWYQLKFPGVSPSQIIIANDSLGGNDKSVWFMNSYYRVGLFINNEGIIFRDVRQYIEGEKEICFDKICPTLNFATFATRVLDDVTYGKKVTLDQGMANDPNIKLDGENYIFSYKNDAGRLRQIKFMPRDISVDGRVQSIDGFILEALTSKENTGPKTSNSASSKTSLYQQSFFQTGLKSTQFLLFVVIATIIPGFILIRLLKQDFLILNIFLSVCLGFVNLTLISYLSGYLKIPWMAGLYVVGMNIFFFFKGMFKELRWEKIHINFVSLLTILIIIIGTIFQSLGMIRSGWVYDFGMGFLGPLGHDGIWHQALIAQLVKNIPPQNPIFAGQIIFNYHYFYDLLVSVTHNLSFVPIIDLLYRFYPVLFSILLGIGTYCLVIKLFNSKIAALISLYFVYFAGSFGWIVTYLKDKNFGGESAFWVNQPVSMNLNPPFAVSLILLIAIVLIIQILRLKQDFKTAIVLMILAGSLAEFKVYAGIIVLGALLIIGLLEGLVRHNLIYLKIFFGALIITGLVFLPQSKDVGQLLIWSPFWFIHSMIDFPDRVGWIKLSSARQAYFERGEWVKFVLAEALALVIFVIGNLGIRFVALFGLITFFKKQLWRNIEFSFIFLILVISFIIPVFMIQQGNPWNTIQFMYYFLYFVAIFTGAVFVWCFKKLPKMVSLLIITLLVLLTPISAWATFRSYLYKIPPAQLSALELQALDFLKNQPEGIVLTYPYDSSLRAKFDSPYPLSVYETSAYVAAFSEKPVFIEDEIQNEILQTDYVKRLVMAKDFFGNINASTIKDEHMVSYVYLPKIFHINLDMDKLKIVKIFENQEVLIFKTLW